MTWKCDNCETEFDDNDEKPTMADDGRELCDECLNDYYSFCEKCEKWYLDGSIAFIDHYIHIEGLSQYSIENYEEKRICERCIQDNYGQCDRCGKWFETSSLENHGDCWYCLPCIHDHYFTCRVCGMFLPFDDMQQDEICVDCFEDDTSPDDDDFDAARQRARELDARRSATISFRKSPETDRMLNDPRSEL